MMEEKERRDIILEHYMHPKHHYRKEEYPKVNTSIASCIDNLDIYIKFNPETKIIEDMCFDGEACAIATSSTSIMIHNLIGKNIEEAKQYLTNIEKMLDHQEYDHELLKEANVFEEIYKQGHRKDCAYLPYKGIKQILNSFKD